MNDREVDLLEPNPITVRLLVGVIGDSNSTRLNRLDKVADIHSHSVEALTCQARPWKRSLLA